MVAAAMNPTTTGQLASRCRAEPLVFDGVRSELCPALEQVILHRMQTDRRRTASLNVGGWKSTEDFFAWPDESVQVLCVIRRAGSRFETDRGIPCRFVPLIGAEGFAPRAG